MYDAHDLIGQDAADLGVFLYVFEFEHGIWSVFCKHVFGLVIDFGTSQSPKSTRPLT
ncbi:hypothetical protein [Thiolapillus sp.]|uniref:hypothetical protein n=1 Tax=Thiolapillus sp. TaxID=2017437 RepID=UPI003AF6B249